MHPHGAYFMYTYFVFRVPPNAIPQVRLNINIGIYPNLKVSDEANGNALPPQIPPAAIRVKMSRYTWHAAQGNKYE